MVKVTVSEDLRVSTDVFMYLDTEDLRLAWVELNGLCPMGPRKSIRVVLGSDVQQWALTVPRTCTVIQLKMQLCEIDDFRVDQLVLVHKKHGNLEDTCTLDDLGVSDLEFIGLMMRVGNTFTLHSSVLTAFDDVRRLIGNERAKLSDMDILAVCSDGEAGFALAPR
jgi:hypothetical protein